jgi:hypothetical protein
MIMNEWHNIVIYLNESHDATTRHGRHGHGCMRPSSFSFLYWFINLNSIIKLSIKFLFDKFIIIKSQTSININKMINRNRNEKEKEKLERAANNNKNILNIEYIVMSYSYQYNFYCCRWSIWFEIYYFFHIIMTSVFPPLSLI